MPYVKKQKSPEDTSDKQAGQILEVLSALNLSLKELGERVNKIEVGMEHAAVPVEVIKESIAPTPHFPARVPVEIENTVREFFGPSFGIKVEDCIDKPAYILTIDVPTKFASSMVFQGEVEYKCLCGQKGKYVRKETTADFACPNVTCTRVIPIQKDLRVKVIGHAEGIPKIREWCGLVRKQIMSYMNDKDAPLALLT